MTTKNVIVGTAGHIDHGKSSLVEALTGTHPDRLQEEKRRGITIDLGFAFLEENGVRFGFVDVPGHERFVSNMLAGAVGIDLVILAIAADESIKPQTREHFEICRLLGVSRGVVALTKSDLVDPDTLGLVRLEVEEFLRGTFLEKEAVIPVSTKTKTGLDQLKNELDRLARDIPGKDSVGHFRLPIDRSFTIKGFGTVVTGTLISGAIKPDDEIELFPVGKRLRVRGVQTSGKAVGRALAGQRTAINLAGIEHTSVRRGMQLAVPGRFRATRRVDARLHLLRGARPLKQSATVHFHSGSAETVAEAVFSDKQIRPGESALVHFRVREPLLLLPGDRFIIREFSPVMTIGGGVVLDAHARRPRAKDTSRPEFLQALESGEPQNILLWMAKRSLLALELAEIRSRTGWADQMIVEVAKNAVTRGQLVQVAAEPLALIDRERFDRVRDKILEQIEKFHKGNPLLPGMPREELRASLGKRIHPAVFRSALEQLTEEKKLELAGEVVRQRGSVIELLPEELEAKRQIEAAFERAGLAVPAVKEVLLELPVETKRAEKLLQILIREKNLYRVTPELIFHRRALVELKTRLATFKKAKGERISVPLFKELTGVTRKYAIPLLEYLDRERVTRRAGDERVIL